MRNLLNTITSGVGEMAGAFTSRREELMRGKLHQLWAVHREGSRVFLVNVSRDIGVQEAWFTTSDGHRQALGRVRPGARAEVRAYRRRADETVEGTLEWRVRSMILPGRSIEREESMSWAPESSANDVPSPN